MALELKLFNGVRRIRARGLTWRSTGGDVKGGELQTFYGYDEQR